jgi:hypothetical protein
MNIGKSIEYIINHSINNLTWKSVKESVYTSVNHHVYLPIYNKVWGPTTYHINTTVRVTIIRTLRTL